MSAHASSSSPSTPRIRLLTRAWGTHEDHAQLWGCRSRGRRCFFLEVVYPVLKTFCERLEVLELILPTRWHLNAARRRREGESKKQADTKTRQRGTRSEDGRQLRIRHRHTSSTQSPILQSYNHTNHSRRLTPSLSSVGLNIKYWFYNLHEQL